MDITIPTELETTLAELAVGNNTTPEEYAGHVMTKHLLALMKEKTATRIAGLPIADIKKVSDDVKVLADSKVIKETPEEAGILTP